MTGAVVAADGGRSATWRGHARAACFPEAAETRPVLVGWHRRL